MLARLNRTHAGQRPDDSRLEARIRSYESTTTYTIDAAQKSIAPKGTIKRFVAIQLSGETTEFGKNKYYQTKDGLWIKAGHIRVTEPGPQPEGLGAGERWIDINLSEQTVVAFEGDRPLYASLISSGKESSVKAKDHRTPSGAWRIRVKHVADTMDGDGSAAGDLPYSIEDVPYVMYFHRSYALHAAFWHRNYGVRMSHGCINLAPLDAKWLFMFAEPKVPAGGHGVFSSGSQPGTMVSVH
jgi:lipoprotein-anchoring transpeptidase ErfK/SrfK